MKQIEIESFNPYENRFPNRKLVTKGTLELIKTLRNEGYEVIVKPNDGKPFHYLYKKGEHNLFSDPVFAYLIGLPTGIIINIISNYLQNFIKKWGQSDSKNNPYEKIIIIDNSVNTITNINGKIIQKSEVSELKEKVKKKQNDFARCFSLESPYPNLPTPIFLEHKPKVIGWGKLFATDKMLAFSDTRILDEKVLKKIMNGNIKGASLTGIAEVSICSICKSNYIECNHIAGNIYGNEKCANEIHEATIVEVSLVKIPINSECLISIQQ